MLSTVRRIYMPPGLHGAYMQDFFSNGRLKQITYPSMQRRVLFTYQPENLLHAVYSDWTETKFSSYPSSDKLKYVNLTDRALNFSYDIVFGPDSAVYGYQHVLPAVSFFGNDLVNASAQYYYDNHYRVVSSETRVGNHQLSVVNASYEAASGKITMLKSFKFDYPRPTREGIQDQAMGIVREYDVFGKPKDVWYRFNNYLVFTMEIKYDSIGRLLNWRRKVGSSDLKTYEYIYDVDGNLAEVQLNGYLAWKYDYDSDGNIVKITPPNNVREFTIDSKGHLVSSTGGRMWSYDKDGFLKQRGKEWFEFNSKGQLIKAFEKGVYHIVYAYDGLNRLVLRRDVLSRTFVQFFYLDIAEPHRVSHIYNQSNSQLDILFYDRSGNLFAFERNGQFYYIASDPSRSPIVVFNSMGSVVKQLTYDPFGNILADTASEFSFPFGFQSGIMDPITKFVHLSGRDYDPETSRWIAPNFVDILENLHHFVEDPQMINLYQYRQYYQGRSSPMTGICIR